MNHIILAIDPSYENTGLCLFDLYSGKYKTKAIPRVPRLSNLAIALTQYTLIRNIIRDAKVTPKLVVIESYAFSANTRSLTQLAELGGILRMAIMQMGIAQWEISPGTWKAITLGHGNLKKAEVHELAVRRFPALAEKSQDEIDAMLMAQAVYESAMQNHPKGDIVRKALGELGAFPIQYKTTGDRK
jgi:Holliday junction resolvasome RuvABC endonuclease subunit